MEGVFDIYNLPVGQSVKVGEAKVSTFEFTTKNDPLYNLQSIRDDGGLTAMKDGKYVRLSVGGELVMSDTSMEKSTNREFCQKAHGRVLIAGLGLGLVLHNLNKEAVEEITVIEKSKNVIDLVANRFPHLPLKVIHADIFEWRPEKGQKWDIIYFDIWSTISEENLEEIRKLHNKFKFYLNRQNPNCWMDSWMKYFLQKRKAQERRSSNGWW